MKFFLLLVIVCAVVAGESPGFFIKLSKSVPRIGRRGSLENFFLKQSKSVPRIGRRASFIAEHYPSQGDNWLERLAKRPQSSNDEPLGSIKVYSKVRPLDLHRIIDILSDDLFCGSDLKFISWDVLDKALEEDPELMGKLSALARDKEVQQLKQLLTDNKEEIVQYVPIESSDPVLSNKAYIYRTDGDNKEKIEYQQ
ncbi:uncharacterized protein LOC129779775 [Toxorhynchites rutilus septentrionalis]|uniref:uncharacterized protein LOC129779775 n=1 Tax=Toxorhynchites rutilus septentrionalis TaxID=329112 RepID=UPI00247ACABB|nr:uncharacterized protein LOC129779775 [Toxorhynchites rutilus septentrionalis]